MRRFLVFASLAMIAAAAPARMYQWVDPDTHTSQLSGKPPTWYRSTEDGPRVFVIENGKVIDDTKVPVPEMTRLQLREDALLQAERDREAAKEKQQVAERLKSAMGQQENSDAETAAPEAAPAPPTVEASTQAKETGKGETGPTAEEMRTLIKQWEKMRTQGARQVVEGTSGTTEMKSEK